MKIIYKAFKQSIPIITGYIPVAISFGILCKTTNLNLWQSAMFSFIVFAGAAQFMSVKMLALGVGSFEIILATFIMNFRMFFMSSVLAENLKKKDKKWYPFISFALTDEVFTVSVVGQKNINNLEVFLIQLFAYLAWGFGTITGYLIGSLFSINLLQSMEIALYSLFIALLTPEAKKSHRVFLLIILSALINTMLKCGKLVSHGTSFIIAVLLSALITSFIPKKNKGSDQNE